MYLVDGMGNLIMGNHWEDSAEGIFTCKYLIAGNLGRKSLVVKGFGELMK